MRHVERKSEVLIVPHHQNGKHQHRPHSNPHHDNERYFQLNRNNKQRFVQHQQHDNVFDDNQQRFSHIYDETEISLERTSFAASTTTLDASEITALQCKIKSYTRKIKKEHKQQKQLLAALQRIEQQNIRIRQLEGTIAHKDDMMNSILAKMKKIQSEHEQHCRRHQQQQQQQQQQQERQGEESSLTVVTSDGNEWNSSSIIQGASDFRTISTSMSASLGTSNNTNYLKQKQQQYEKEQKEFEIKRTGLTKKRDTMQSKVEHLISKLLPSSPPS